MSILSRALFGAVVVGTVVAAPHGARASSYRLNPVTLTLTANASTALVTVTNDSPDALRFQITGFAWDQKPDGAMDLQPSNDIVYYPSMLKLAPGESRKLRVGMNATP